MKVVWLGTVLWAMSFISAVLALIYAVVGSTQAMNAMEMERVFLISLALALFPWILAYSLTRVLYGVESLLEE